MMKQSARALAVLFLASLIVPNVKGDDSDIFMVDSVPPNVMILIDSSGSMSNSVAGEVKMNAAKRVVNDLVNNVQGVRLGAFRFNGSSDGGLLVAPLGEDPAVTNALVNSISPNGWTPLGRAAQDMQDYFLGTHTSATCTGDCDGTCDLSGGGGDDEEDEEDEDEEDEEDEHDEDEEDEGGGMSCDPPEVFVSPIQYACQKNYAIIITDGMPNGEDTNLVADVALSLYTTDHHPGFAGTQNVIVHTVGFDVPAGTALLTQTAANGGGNFYTASNADELEAALLDALSGILADSYSFAAPVIPAGTVAGGTQAYFASFEPDPLAPFWNGHLKAYTRNSSGLVPLDANGKPDSTALVWDAGALLDARTPGSRTIYTAVSGARTNFSTSNAALTAAMFGAADTAERDKIINFVLGTDSFDSDADGNVSEERDWKLGDIFHSEPVLVFPPVQKVLDADYDTFKTARAGRTAIVLAGGNDGMLHAFRASDGLELWGFVPPDLLDDLIDLTPRIASHPYFVDGTPVVADVKIGGAWKTIVVFGQRRGGGTYHALDISDTSNPTYLWSFSDSEITEGWSTPQIGRVKMADGTAKYVAFVGGGYNTAANNSSGRGVFAVDLASGAKLWEYKTGGSADAQYANFSFPAEPTVVDLDFNGWADRVYIGDVGGQLWKFDISAPATLSGGMVTNWSGKRLFTALPSQANPPTADPFIAPVAMYGTPRLAYDKAGSLWVLVGTGDRNNPKSASTNKFYAIKDDTSMTNGSALTESSLVDVTSGNPVTQGWYRALASNEKVLSTADVFNNTIFFTTYEPETVDICTASLGNALLYAVRMGDGLPAVNWSNGQKLTNPTGSDPASTDAGDGIGSDASVVLGDTGDTVVVGAADGEVTEFTMPSTRVKRIQSWREVY